MSQISSKPSSPPLQTKRPGFVHFYTSQLYAFWKFCRPHTVIGTSLSVLSLYLIAVATGGQEPGLGKTLTLVPLHSLFFALLACLGGNVYIVGLNQLEDVAIDRINKPHLPLAAGEFSRRQAWAIVAVAGMLAILLALWQGPFLLATVGVSLLIGTAYSLPPIRLKRFPVWASLCIFTVRGVIVNLGLFLHFHGFLHHPTQAYLFTPSLIPNPSLIPAPVWGLTLFVLVFTFAIAIFKDIPDAEGDRQYNITTFTLKLGQRNVFDLAMGVITVCYLGMVVAAVDGLPGTHPLFLVSTHLGALGWLWLRSQQVDLQEKASISRFYQFIWKLFFLEYLMFPVACLLG
jgi:homogentisate phytyltransferase/homogentisate geranylgeranyltransferase